MNESSRHLAFHGSIVLLFGLLLGAPYAGAINRNAAANIVNSWRIAHQSLPLAAALMFAVAALMPLLDGHVAAKWVVALAFIVSSYAFCVSMPLAAITGHRGLAPGARGLARLVYLGNVLGAWSSMAAAVALVSLLFVSL